MTTAKLNPKQAQVLKQYLSGEVLYKAYMTVYGCSEASAKSGAFRMLEKVRFSELGGGMDLDEFNQVLAGMARNATDNRLRIRALNLIGRTLGAYTENLNVKGDMTWRAFIEGRGVSDDSA